MWSKVKKVLGYLWASPITAVGLLYTNLLTLAGWYDWHGIEGDSLVWTVNDTTAPKLLLSLWRPWSGHTVGNVVVLRHSPSTRPTVLVHEQKHVDQFMRLGVLQPVIYVMCYLAIRFGCTGSDPYYTNPFEVDARRHAGQVVDIEGAIKRITTRIKRSG